MVIIIMSVIAALMVLMGWGVHKKQWYFLISGYNMMSKEEQAQVDVKGLAKAVAYMSYIVAFLLVGLGLSINFELFTLVWVFTGLMIVILVGLIFYSRKFYQNGANFMGKNSPKAKKISTIITVVSLVVVGVIIYFSIQPTKFTLTEEQFSISGSYGEDMRWDDITTIALIDELPEIALRTNGSAVGTKLKGNFKLENGEKVKLFLDKSVKSFIVIEWNNQKFILNEPTEAETEKLYDELRKKWSK